MIRMRCSGEEERRILAARGRPGKWPGLPYTAGMLPGDSLKLPFEERRILSVSALNREARQLVENALGSVWVEGEISNLARPSSGHLYWSLKDAQAQVRCAMFRMSTRTLSFELANARPLAVADNGADWDVLILTRGGGSLEDLWSFNEEIVARAIAAVQLPIIVGVGHEIDFTIADFVADLRAPTPSQAAELAVPDQVEWRMRFASLAQRLAQTVRRQLTDERRQLAMVEHRLARCHPGVQLREREQRLDPLEAPLA